MSKLLQQKRVLICTFVALASGFFSSYIGGQISLKAHSHKCQAQPWGLKALCNTWVAPGAIWQGSTTGLWMGTVLGAFVGGLATRKTSQEISIPNRDLSKTSVPAIDTVTHSPQFDVSQ